MPFNVTNGAMTMCTFGAAPATLNVLPINRVLVGGQPAATTMDSKPMLNIMPFGMCNSPSNPIVAAATAAALGVLTPMPCIPATTAPWAPTQPTTQLANQPALTADSKCMCMWGGLISINLPGQFQTQTG
jgi:hypothetical protein